MKFGDTPLDQAVGAIFAHNLKLGGRVFRKGRVVTVDDVAALRAAGLGNIVAARLEPGDIGEDEAANRIAGFLAGNGIVAAPAFTGRANLFAEAAGLCRVDRAAVNRLNAIDEAITLATLEPDTVVAPKQMVATVKIIPFAVAGERLAACERAVAGGSRLVAVAPFTAKRAVLIQTELPGLKPSILDKTVEVTRARLAALGGTLIGERRVAHDAAALVPAITAALADQAELVLVAGASAILDRRDVIPAAVEAAGGMIVQFGMPVDPGNLLLVGRIGAADVLGLPGCARSPQVNGFDWMLRRLMAGLPIDAAAVRAMGVGGLLGEIPSRPLPRAEVARAAAPPGAPPTRRIAAVVLAAGRSRRMGTLNKLLIGVDGKPMVRHAVDAALAAGLAPVVVVTGHEREKVTAALAGLPVSLVDNPDYVEGLSTSLKAGLGILPPEAEGALICLADMPRVSAAELKRLAGAFDPREGRAIVVPTRHGKRGNPVLWARQFFAEMRAVAGDVGARHLIGAYPELVAEIEMEGDGVLTDIDTPQALAKLATTAKIEA
ncbi:MAG: molybdopterin-binding/glycosyltransferase family 2 protein [Alphaproteobacteria bacterium]|nr:molybdopterin-binding/glycosyltransferase family 2 protein [Alphaproteobacteria bacterium]